MNSRKTAIILAHVFIGWALERVMGAITTWTSSFFYTLGAVLIFVVVSWIYFKKFNYTTPWLTGIVFTGIIMAANFFEVAFLNNRFLELYASLPQTWLRFALIFVAIYLTGLFTTNGSDSSSTSKAKKAKKKPTK